MNMKHVPAQVTIVAVQHDEAKRHLHGNWLVVLIQPLRRRIQKIIDRRFYRRQYDAATIIANFSSTLRDEVDLDTLSNHLVAVVQETMQPEHVS